MNPDPQPCPFPLLLLFFGWNRLAFPIRPASRIRTTPLANNLLCCFGPYFNNPSVYQKDY
jgi:hypothetical protein